MEKPKKIRFQFFGRPVAILGGARVQAVRFERTEPRGDTVVGTGDYSTYPAVLS